MSKRAKYLRRSAQKITSEYDGTIPSKPEEIKNLYGVGQYTTNALMCFAFGKSVPTVDSNVRRVIKRIFAQTIGKVKEDKKIVEIASSLAEKGKIPDINYALLDLGATVCKPGQTLKEGCPVKKLCENNFEPTSIPC